MKEQFVSDELPILYPLARYGDCLIFPYLDLKPDCPDVKPAAMQLQQATRDIKLPGIPIAGYLRRLNLTNGEFVYSDIFPDDTITLQEAI